MDRRLWPPHPTGDRVVTRCDVTALYTSEGITQPVVSSRRLRGSRRRALAGLLGPTAFLLLGGCVAADSSDPEPGPAVSTEPADTAPERATSEVSAPPVHWQSDRIAALELLRDLVVHLPVRMVESVDRPETMVVGNWRLESTYALLDGRLRELQARERPIDCPSPAWAFLNEGTFRRTTERCAWSGSVSWFEFGPDEPMVPGWYLLEMEEVVTSPPGLPFGNRQIAIVGFVDDAMLLALWEDTRRNPPDLVWRFVRYSGVGG